MLGLLLRLALDARLSSALVGGPWLLGVCERESLCELVSVHPGDAWMARTLGEGWSTRGVHGHVAAFAWPHVPAWARWAGPVALDVPIVSAIVSVRRARHWRCGQARACRAWRGSSWTRS